MHVVLTIVMIRFAFESKWISNRSSGCEGACSPARSLGAFGLSHNGRDASWLSLVSLGTTHAVRNQLNLPGSWPRTHFVVIREVSPPQLATVALLSRSQALFINNRLICFRPRPWCQLLRVRAAAVSSVCVLPRNRCRDRGWDRGGDRAQQR